MPRLGSSIVVVVRAPLVSDGGGKYRDWNSATRTSVTGCDVQPFKLSEKLSFEDDADREFQRAGYRFYCPATADIVYTDRIEWNGHTYEVFGGVGLWYRLAGMPDHIAFVAREYLG